MDGMVLPRRLYVSLLTRHHRHDDWDLYAAEIQDKTAAEVKAYFLVFKKKWKQLAGTWVYTPPLLCLHGTTLEYPRIAARITEGEAKRNKRDNLEFLLTKKIASVRYPMQELELNYPTTKGKVYSEEEDRYLLCRLNYYGMRADDVYERIKKDITEFPVFRLDWFFKSRSPQELQRRCNTLLGMIEKEAETNQQEEVKVKGGKGKVRPRLISAMSWLIWLLQKRNIEEVQKADKDLDDPSRASTPAGATTSVAKRSHKKKKA